MKVKVFNKSIGNVPNVFFSSDLHINHKNILKFGRVFSTLEEMNELIINNINKTCTKDDLLVLLGDSLLGIKDYEAFCNSINCNIILLYGNHCNLNKVNELSAKNLLYKGHYLEIQIEKTLICCSHYPTIHWNEQDKGSYFLHGHCHGYESNILKEIHTYRSKDVGIDCYFEQYGEYLPYSFEQIKNELQNKKTINRHEE